MDEKKSTVYVLLDGDKIMDINSSDFLTDTEGWVAIDQGNGDRYMHAYRHYLPGRPCGPDGVPLWRLVDRRPVERTEEEIQKDLEILISNTPLSNDLQTKLAIAELAELENAHDLENKLAIAELAELLLGGDK